MYGYIYKTTNLINSKIYIGQHKSNVFTNKYLGSGTLLTDSIRKYGKDNFKVECICKCNSKKSLDEKEVYYIKYLNSTDLSIGYNITQGGQSRFFTGMTHTSESRKRMSDRAKARPHPPTTKGNKWMNNGNVDRCVKQSEIETFLKDGYTFGRINANINIWNKGLTKKTSEKMMSISVQRKALLADKSVGCCSYLKGKQHPNSTYSKCLEIADKAFLAYLNENGKGKTMSYYNIGPHSFKNCCEILNINHMIYKQNIK